MRLKNSGTAHSSACADWMLSRCAPTAEDGHEAASTAVNSKKRIVRRTEVIGIAALPGETYPGHHDLGDTPLQSRVDQIPLTYV